MRRSSTYRAYLALATSMTLVGSSVPVSKALADDLPVMLVSAIRMPIATLILAFLVWRSNSGSSPIKRHDLGIMTLQSLSGVVAFNILLLFGLRMTSATTSGIIASATPAFVAIFALLLGERLSRIAGVGIVVTTLGVVFINITAGDNSGSSSATSIVGGSLIVGAVIAGALYTIFGKSLRSRVRPLENSFYVSFTASVLFMPLGLRDLRSFPLADVSVGNWIGILYLAVFVTVAAFTLWFSGLATVTATSAGVFTGLIPIAAIVCAALFLGEHVGLGHLVALVCVLAGIVLVTRGTRGAALTR